MPTLEDAVGLALSAHKGQRDKVGQPYILHPLRVMMAVKGELAQMAAVLHDVVEDSDVSFEDLRRFGYDEELIGIVELLTRRDDESYTEFVARAAGHPVARAVKLADIEDNMDVRRLPTLGETELARLQRYRDAWRMLMDTDTKTL